MFNAKMKTKNRNVILFIDNATCHTKVTLSKVKIAWFPENATNVL
jgi:ABC-type phosphate transport system auxiliary subunit